MEFDPCPHRIIQIVIKAAKLRRKELGMPVENNITVLYDEMAILLRLPPQKMDSSKADHLPSPSEMKNKTGKFTIQRKDCSVCGIKETMILISLCPSCKDSEGGKYHSAWKCTQGGCTGIEKSEKFLVQRLDELGIEVSGTKESMGIKTLTDEGLK